MASRSTRPLTVADAIRATASAGTDLILALWSEHLLGETGEVLGAARAIGTDRVYMNVSFTFEQVLNMLDRLDAEAAQR